MRVRNLFLRGAVLLGLATVTLGCSREASVVQPPPVEVVVSHPTLEDIETFDTYTGTLDARESVDIRSRVRGEIKEVKFVDGEEVKKDAPLFIIDDGPFKADLEQAKGQLTTWQAKLKAAEEKVAFYEPLAKKGTVSKEE